MDNENVVEGAEQSWRVTDRRSFLLKGAAVALRGGVSPPHLPPEAEPCGGASLRAFAHDE